MAGNAQEQLSKELGPGFEDVDVRDLNPKTFIQKHLLDDVEPVVADVKKEITTAKTLGVRRPTTSPRRSTPRRAPTGARNGAVGQTPRRAC